MNIVNLTESAYAKWDAFCANSKDAWFWHTSMWLEYTRGYKPELKSRPLSFFVMENNEILAVCPLLLETNGKRKEFTFGGGGTPTPALSSVLSEKAREKTRKFLFTHLDTLAEEHKVSRIEFRFPVLNENAISRALPHANYLPRFGYLDTSIATQVIQLGKGIAKLAKDVRHGHSADIDRAKKSLACEIIDNANITHALFDPYPKMHALAAGRITRPARTFEIQYELIKSGNAFLAVAKKDGELAGFSYVIVYQGSAYYASACNDPRFSRIPIAHFLQWNSIEYIERKGIKLYEIGWQRFMPSLSGIWSEKEISISKFTRGFGGVAVPLLRGEKYYDAKYFLDVYKGRLKAGAQVIVSVPKKDHGE